jgi:hypothetical protein
VEQPPGVGGEGSGRCSRSPADGVVVEVAGLEFWVVRVGVVYMAGGYRGKIRAAEARRRGSTANRAGLDPCWAGPVAGARRPRLRMGARLASAAEAPG